MADSLHLKSAELERRLDDVRRGLFRRRCLRALLVFGAGSFAVTTLWLAWNHVRGGDPRDWLLGVAAFIVVEVAMGASLLFSALRRNPTSRQIALYVDEHHPELENLILSAVEIPRSSEAGVSAWMIDRILADPRLEADRLRLTALVPRGAGLRFFGAAVCLLLVWLLILMVGLPLWLPQFEVGGLLNPQVRRALIVEPGDARVRPGQNPVIVAKVNQPGPEAILRWRTGGGEWSETAMTPGKSPELHYHSLGRIEESILYEVAWNGLRSPQYELAIWEPPQVESVDLTYHYPDYLEMSPRRVPGGGNIAGVQGTRVEIRLAANKPLEAASLILESGAQLNLEREGELAWSGALLLSQDDAYRIELRDAENETNQVSRRYQVTVKPDLPPKIKVIHPRGDSDATLLDEVPFEFEVEDDFGIADYGLQYQIGDGEPHRVSLKETEGGDYAMATHALALEEMNLETGDLVTWSAWAEDRRPGREPFEGFGDLYFLQLRPFAQRFVEAPSQQGGGMGGGGGGQQLTELQKNVLIATWNLRSRLPQLDPREYDADRATILEMELKVLHQVEELKQNASTPEATELLQELGSALSSAVRSLEHARGTEAVERLTEAERYERTAYELLLSGAAEEIQVSQVRSTSAQQRQNNPVGLEELELDRNRNFYEEESRTQDEDPEADEALDRLRELSARQALINEEIAKLISELSQARSPEEEKELQRRLERLKEEIRQNLEQLDELEQQIQNTQMSSQELREATERIDEARRQNTSSLETLESQGGQTGEDSPALQEARSAGRRALDALQTLEEELTNRSSQSVEERLDELVARFHALADGTRDFVERLDELKTGSEGPGLRAPQHDDEERMRLLDQAEELNEEFVSMMQSAGSLAEDAGRSQPLTSRELGDWLRETSGEGIAEDLEAARESLDYALWDAAEASGTQAVSKLSEAEGQLHALLDTIVRGEEDAHRIALDRLQDLMKQAGISMEDAPGAGTKEGEEGRGARDTVAKGPSDPGRPDSPEQGGAGEAESSASGDGVESEERRSERETGRGGTQGSAPGDFEIAWDMEADPLESGESRGDDDGGREAGQESASGSDPTGSEIAGSPGEASEEEGNARRGGDVGLAQAASDDPMAGEPGGEAEPARGRVERSREGERSAGRGNSGPGEMSDWTVDPERLFRRDYRDWIDRLRSAQTVLGEGDEISKELDRIALEMERLRRETRRRGHPPRFDLFLERVALPLEAAAQELASRLQRSARENDLMLPDSEEVPAQYQKLVADYFETLSAGIGPVQP